MAKRLSEIDDIVAVASNKVQSKLTAATMNMMQFFVHLHLLRGDCDKCGVQLEEVEGMSTRSCFI